MGMPPPVPPPEIAAAPSGNAPMPTGGTDPMSSTAMEGPGSAAQGQIESVKNPKPQPSNSRYSDDPDAEQKDWSDVAIKFTSNVTTSPAGLAGEAVNAITALPRAGLELGATILDGVSNGLKDNLGPVGTVAAIPLDIASKTLTSVSSALQIGGKDNDSFSVVLRMSGPGKRKNQEDIQDSFENDKRGSMPKKPKMEESASPSTQTPTGSPMPANMPTPPPGTESLANVASTAPVPM